jgi:hypothetical protein
MQDRMRFILPIGVLVLMLFSGCNQNSEKRLRPFTPPEDEAKATNYISLLRQGGFDQIQKDMDASITDADTHSTLVKMGALIPPQDPVSVKVVGAHQYRTEDTYKINLTFEYQFPTNWLLINVALQKKNGVSSIYGFHVEPLSEALEDYNRFTLAGKNPFQYAMLALAILIPIFSLYVLVLCIRTKMKKRKWLWIIFILLGFGKITVSWTTGHWQYGLFQFQLFGASAFAPPFGAWLISVSVPLGAILFLLWRKKLTATIEPVISESPTP